MAVAADDLGAIAKSMRASNASAPPSPDLVQRVELLETAFTSMIDRHQKSLHDRNDIASWVEQCVKDLQQQRRRVRSRLCSDAFRSAAPRFLPITPPSSVADLPLPAKVARLIVEPPPIAAMPAVAGFVSISRTPPIFHRSFLRKPYPITSYSEEAVLMDNYLLDARRAAIATQAGSERERHEAKRRSNRTRVSRWPSSDR